MKTTGDRPSDALQTRFTPLQTPSNPGSDAVSHALKCLQTTSDGPFTLSPYIPPARLNRPTRPSEGRSQAFQTPTSSFMPNLNELAHRTASSRPAGRASGQEQLTEGRKAGRYTSHTVPSVRVECVPTQRKTRDHQRGLRSWPNPCSPHDLPIAVAFLRCIPLHGGIFWRLALDGAPGL